MKRKSFLTLLIALMATGLIGYASLGFGAHTGGPVPLVDADGNTITTGSAVPYSPKQTCGVCHTYESDPALAVKNHGTGLPTYAVPYPQHGVTAGYHFQQGRNLNWGDTQREFFHQADFTSSGGMYGKY
jgi:hypothetical protein